MENLILTNRSLFPMKIREGFVSNSSTTSFCIAGIWSENDNLLDKGYSLEDLMFEDGLVVYSHPDSYDEAYVGLDIQDMKDDETMEGFKKRAQFVLEKYFKKVKVSLHTDGWRDG